MGNKKKADLTTEANARALEDSMRAAEEEVKFYQSILSQITKSVEAGLEILEELRPVNLKNIKESCVVELQRFIHQRGTIDKSTNTVNLRLMSQFDHNKNATIEKIKAANALIEGIEQADSLETLRDLLQKAPSSGGDLEGVIGQCLVITNTAATSNPLAPQ